MIDAQLKQLTECRRTAGGADPTITRLSNGGTLIRIPGVRVEGWSRPTVDILFVAPPGYPAAQPDCFWVEPNGFRLANGATPQASNDSNPIPGDVLAGRSTTWFSWHVQSWNPTSDTLQKYFKVIMNRLKPAR
ncbi:MAG: E2/UBC family protein [Acidiferrobacterales bacterium]